MTGPVIAGAGGCAIRPCPTKASAGWRAQWKRMTSITPPARRAKRKVGARRRWGVVRVAVVRNVSPGGGIRTRTVAYLGPADNYLGPLVSRLSGVNQPVISTRNAFSTPSSHPVGLRLSTPQPLPSKIIQRCRFLDRLRLGPRRDPKQQHFFQCPDVVSQSRGHRRRTRPPRLGRACTVGGHRLRQGLA